MGRTEEEAPDERCIPAGLGEAGLQGKLHKTPADFFSSWLKLFWGKFIAPHLEQFLPFLELLCSAMDVMS